MGIFRRKRKDKTASDWVFESLLTYMRSPRWDVPVLEFIDRNCVQFDQEEENKFIYTAIHDVRSIGIFDWATRL